MSPKAGQATGDGAGAAPDATPKSLFPAETGEEVGVKRVPSYACYAAACFTSMFTRLDELARVEREPLAHELWDRNPQTHDNTTTTCLLTFLALFWDVRVLQ